MGDLGLPELLVIALLVLLLFGTRKIPDLARGLGEGIRTFKAGLRGDDPRVGEPRRDPVEAGGGREAPGPVR
jgi:sec-independent protein translocase protein TatA